jgi:hypothetical protein
MLENRLVVATSPLVKRSLNTTAIRYKIEFWEAQNWLKGLEGYRTLLYGILHDKGVSHGRL